MLFRRTPASAGLTPHTHQGRSANDSTKASGPAISIQASVRGGRRDAVLAVCKQRKSDVSTRTLVSTGPRYTPASGVDGRQQAAQVRAAVRAQVQVRQDQDDGGDQRPFEQLHRRLRLVHQPERVDLHDARAGHRREQEQVEAASRGSSQLGHGRLAAPAPIDLEMLKRRTMDVLAVQGKGELPTNWCQLRGTNVGTKK